MRDRPGLDKPGTGGGRARAESSLARPAAGRVQPGRRVTAFYARSICDVQLGQRVASIGMVEMQ